MNSWFKAVSTNKSSQEVAVEKLKKNILRFSNVLMHFDLNL